MPDEQLIVRWHLMISQQLQTFCARKLINGFEIADAALRITSFQPLVERRIAFAGVVVMVAERTIDAEFPARLEDLSDAPEEIFDLVPGHDMQGVGAEYCADWLNGPWMLSDIKGDGRREIRYADCAQVFPQSGNLAWQLRRLPMQMTQMSSEVKSVLPRSTADFQDRAAIG